MNILTELPVITCFKERNVTIIKYLAVSMIIAFITNLVYCQVSKGNFVIAFIGRTISCGTTILLQE